MKTIIIIFIITISAFLGFWYEKQRAYPTFLYIDYQKNTKGERGIGHFYCDRGEFYLNRIND